jgi:hypothetical protein
LGEPWRERALIWLITSRDPATLAGFQREVEQLGRRALPLGLDVREL